MEMKIKELEQALAEQIAGLETSQIPTAPVEYEEVSFDWTEPDNARWLEIIRRQLASAASFEIHCWNEETEWIDLALKYGSIKNDGWQYGKKIAGSVTKEFSEMLLSLPKPTDIEYENKMTPFFNIFLDDTFQSCHYGTEVFFR